jgi:hypothetical protein
LPVLIAAPPVQGTSFCAAGCRARQRRPRYLTTHTRMPNALPPGASSTCTVA